MHQVWQKILLLLHGFCSRSSHEFTRWGLGGETQYCPHQLWHESSCRWTRRGNENPAVISHDSRRKQPPARGRRGDFDAPVCLRNEQLSSSRSLGALRGGQDCVLQLQPVITEVSLQSLSARRRTCGPVHLLQQPGSYSDHHIVKTLFPTGRLNTCDPILLPVARQTQVQHARFTFNH